VSVTQQMNTTDSLGRLTLNILLSFAQFERELIAERTRDKMRAARRKGKWLGGHPVLGYDVDPQGGGLKVNTSEAERVRFIFQSMAEGRSGGEAVYQLSRRGWTTKTWTSRSGRQHRGRPFQESDVIRLVKNVTYLGKLRDGEQIYPAEHAAIVDSDHWERANAAFVDVPPGDARELGNRVPSSTEERGTRVPASPPLPRISRLLALALKMEEMIQAGTVKKYSDLAHLGQVSAARITQLMNLLHLAPDIQEQILSPDTPMIELRESAVRKLSSVVLWDDQRVRWQELLAAASAQQRAALRPRLRPTTQP